MHTQFDTKVKKKKHETEIIFTNRRSILKFDLKIKKLPTTRKKKMKKIGD